MKLRPKEITKVGSFYTLWAETTICEELTEQKQQHNKNLTLEASVSKEFSTEFGVEQYISKKQQGLFTQSSGL